MRSEAKFDRLRIREAAWHATAQYMAAQHSPPNAPREEFVPREQSDAPEPSTSPEGQHSTQKYQKGRRGHSHLHVLRVTDQVPGRFQFHMGGKRRVCDEQTAKSEEQAHCCSREDWPHGVVTGLWFMQQRLLL
jgi:hypothetical protein